MRNSIVRFARVSAVVSFVVGLAATALQPVFATPPAAATATPRPATPKPTATAVPNIIVKPITQNASVKSYKTQIAMKLDGKSESKVAKGDFVVEAQALPATKKQSLALGGSLMGQLLGKYLRGLPVSKLTLYLQDKNTFVLAQSLLTVCAVPKTPIAGLDQISSGLTADAMLASLSGSNKIYGTLIGDETVNGIVARRYKLDVPKMNALAKQNRLNVDDKKWRRVAGERW